MAEDQWKWWRDALAGKMPESERGKPRAGFWKAPQNEPIAIWWEAGQCYCERQRFGGGARMSLEQIDDLYGASSRYPITEEVYRSIVEDGEDPPPGFNTRLTLKEIQAGVVWSLELGLKKLGPSGAAPADEPDDFPAAPEATSSPAQSAPVAQEVAAAEEEPPPPGIGHNNPPEELPPEQALAKDVSRRAAALKVLLAGYGGKPRTKAEADLVADYATTFGNLAKKAEDSRTKEKAPHLEKCREIDAKWSGVKTNADTARKVCLDHVKVWLDEENARIKEETRKANEAARLAAEKAGRYSDEPVEAPPPIEPATVNRVGNMRSVTARTRKVWKVVDPKAYGTWLLGMETINPDLLEVLHKLAQRQGAAGVKMPGVEAEEKRSAA